MHFFAKRKGIGLIAFICSANMRTVRRPMTLFNILLVCIIFGSRCGYRIFSLRDGGLVCLSSVSACSPYIPNAIEPMTLFSQRVWCGAQHFLHLWEFVAFFLTLRITLPFITFWKLDDVVQCFSICVHLTRTRHLACERSYEARTLRPATHSGPIRQTLKSA